MFQAFKQDKNLTGFSKLFSLFCLMPRFVYHYKKIYELKTIDNLLTSVLCRYFLHLFMMIRFELKPISKFTGKL